MFNKSHNFIADQMSSHTVVDHNGVIFILFISIFFVHSNKYFDWGN